MDGVKLRFEEGALKAIAEQALKRDTGARGLRAILEKAMLDIMYEVPSDSRIREVLVKESVIRRADKPLIVYERKEAEPA
jgi:ATP-dependent Clp protease ATP-binding subunit ClpX